MRIVHGNRQIGGDMKGRILFFDDDYASMEPLREVLEEHGYSVLLTAAEGVLTQLAHERFDLVIVDVMIHPTSLARGEEDVVRNVHYPDINWQETGLEFLRRLRRGDYEGGNGQGTLRTVPAIILSATADPDEPHEAQAIFEKPFDLEEVVTQLDALLKR